MEILPSTSRYHLGQQLKDAGLPDSLAGVASYDNRGRMLLFLSRPGTYRLEARYGGPPGWQWRSACVAALAAASLALLHRAMARPRATARRPARGPAKLG